MEPGGRVWKRKEERSRLRCREFQVGSPPPRRYRGSQVKKPWESLGGNSTSFLQCLHSAKQQTRSKTPSARRYFSSYCASHVAMATSNMLLPLLPPNATLFTIFPRRTRWKHLREKRAFPRAAEVAAGASDSRTRPADKGQVVELNAAAGSCSETWASPHAPPPTPSRPPSQPGGSRFPAVLCSCMQPALPGRRGRSAPLPPPERARAPVGRTVIGAGLSLAKWLCRVFNLCSSESNKAWGHWFCEVLSMGFIAEYARFMKSSHMQAILSKEMYRSPLGPSFSLSAARRWLCPLRRPLSLASGIHSEIMTSQLGPFCLLSNEIWSLSASLNTPSL